MFGKKFGIALAAALMLAACGKNAFDSLADKNSGAATKEAAQIAINSGDYTTAITILKAQCPNNQCPDNATSQQLAAAYMGDAGLDVLNLVKTMDQANKGTNTNVDFANISSSLKLTNAASTSSADVAAANTANAAKLTAIDNAIQVLSAIPAQNRTADQNLQLGMAQASAAVIAVGSVSGGYDANGIPAICAGNCSANNISAALGTNITTSTGTTSAAAYFGTQLINASTNINASVGGSTTNNSTAQQTNDLTYNVQGGACSGSAPSTYTPPAALTANQVTTYVITCL